MSTIHTVYEVDDTVIKLQKRSAETSTNAKNAQAAFQDEAQAELPVLKVINDYNYCINSVNIADQFLEPYHT